MIQNSLPSSYSLGPNTEIDAPGPNTHGYNIAPQVLFRLLPESTETSRFENGHHFAGSKSEPSCSFPRSNVSDSTAYDTYNYLSTHGGSK